MKEKSNNQYKRIKDFIGVKLESFKVDRRDFNLVFGLAGVMIAFSFGVFYFILYPAIASDYSFLQTDWSGGADTVNFASYPDDETGWTKYFSKDAEITAGTELDLTITSASSVQSTDSDFGAGTLSQAEVSGTGSSASVVLEQYQTSPPWETMTATPGAIYSGAGLAHPGSGDYIYALQGSNTAFYRYSISGNSWDTMTATPGAISTGGALVYPGSGDYLYALRGGGDTDFYRYSISGNTWSSMTVTPGAINSGGALVYPGSGDYIYALQGGSAVFYRYSISGNTWSSMADTTYSSSGASLVSTSNDYIYSTRGNGHADFYRYSIAGNSWTTMTSVPGGYDRQGALVYPGSGDYIYGLRGLATTDFYRYSISGNSWETMKDAPGTVSFGAALTYPGSGNYIYGLRGNNTTDFYRYDITASDNWAAMTDAPAPFNQGGDMIYPGSGEYIYVSRGDKIFYRYSVTNNTWEAMTGPLLGIYGGSSLTAAGNYIYATRAGSYKYFMRYSIAGNSWGYMTDTPASIYNGSDLIYPGSGDYLYLTRGSYTSFYRYSISGNSWDSLAVSPTSFNQGSALLYPGSGDYFYATKGGGFSHTGFYRYSISGNVWEVLADSPGAMDEGGDLVYPGSGDYIYALRGGDTTDFYVYSISNNTWSTTLSSISGSVVDGGALAYPGSGHYLYALRGVDNNDFYRYQVFNYYDSGTLVSSASDTGQGSNFSGTTLDFNINKPAGTDLGFRLRSATTEGGLAAATYYGPTGTGDYYTASGQTINAIHDGDRWAQYQAYSSTTDSTATATLDDITINYEYYPASKYLISSPFDSSDETTALAQVLWTESLPAGTDVKFQLRSAPDDSGAPGVWTSWLGQDGTNGTYFTDPAGGEEIPEVFADESGDQWMQYKVFLETTDGSQTPTLSDFTLAYGFTLARRSDATTESSASGSIVVESASCVSSDEAGEAIITLEGTNIAEYLLSTNKYFSGSDWQTFTGSPMNIGLSFDESGTYDFYVLFKTSEENQSLTYGFSVTIENCVEVVIGVGETVEIDLADEATLNMGVGSEVEFDIADASHNVTVDNIDVDAGVAQVTVESDPIVLDLEVGIAQQVDTDGDGINDLEILLEEIVSADEIKLSITKIEDSTDDVVEGFPYSAGVALKSPESAKVYLFDESGQLRWLVDKEAFFQYFDSWDAIQLVDESILSQLVEGEEITPTEITYVVPADFPYSAGDVLRGSDSPKVYLFSVNGSKRWILNEKALFEYVDSWAEVIDVDADVLALLEEGTSISDSNRFFSQNFFKIFRFVTFDFLKKLY